MSQSGLLVSIIMPCYNAARYIGAAIESVLSQQYGYFELIIVNDGSTDDSERIIHGFTDPRIRYFKQENKGQCAASNFGLMQAKGDVIKFFDADDVMNDFHLMAQVERMNGDSDVLISCAWGRFYGHDPSEAHFIPEPVWRDLSSLDWIKAALTQRNDMMGAPLWLIPRSVIEITGGWDDRLSLNNDFEFSMRLLTHVKEVRFAEDAKLYYRSGNMSLSQRPSLKAFEAAVLSTDLGCSYLLAKENSDHTRGLCADRYQEWLFRIYPYDAHLEMELEQKIHALGGSKRQMDGGSVHRFLCRIIGWKRAKLLKNYLHSFGYRKLPFN